MRKKEAESEVNTLYPVSTVNERSRVCDASVTDHVTINAKC